MSTHPCAAPGCDKQIASHLLMCFAHWKQVPAPLRMLVLDTWRQLHADPANKYRAYWDARKAAIESLATPAVADPAPLLTPIYLAGYSHDGSGSKDGTPKQYCRKPETLREITDHLGTSTATVIDIRYAPGSQKFPEWNAYNLRGVLGARYCWFREWGNLNYQGDPIHIANFEAGLKRLQVMSAARPAPRILLCACRHIHCHRYVVADLLREHGYSVSDLDWTIHLPTERKEIRDVEPSLF